MTTPRSLLLMFALFAAPMYGCDDTAVEIACGRSGCDEYAEEDAEFGCDEASR